MLGNCDFSVLDCFQALRRDHKQQAEDFLLMDEQAECFSRNYRPCSCLLQARSLIVALLMFSEMPVFADATMPASPAGAGLPGSKTRLLQGGVKDTASLHPSLKLMPGGTGAVKDCQFYGSAASFVAPLGAQMQRGPGGVMYAPGMPVPQLVPSAETRGGVIAPISSYTLMPVNGVLVAPGYGVQRFSTAGDSSYPSQYSDPQPVTSKGVTSYVSGCESLSLKPVPPPRTAGTGVTVFEPGYESTRVEVVTAGHQTDTTTSHLPGFSYSPAALTRPGSGIVCWSPGYEVSVQSAQVLQEKLAGIWSAQVPGIPQLQATPLSLANFRTFVEPAKPESLTVAPKLLPGLKPEIFPSNLTWPDWYNRVAKSIYSRWQTFAVCPGQATVRATVNRSRVMTCLVVDFTPAATGERNVAAETEFRESALAAANGVSIFEIPAFPEHATEDSVTIDVVMRRSVDGPSGFSVASAKR
jgi:hypothetical protein